MRRRLILVWCALLGLCSALKAQQTYDLRSRYRVGQILTVRHHMQMDLRFAEGKPDSGGGSATGEMDRGQEERVVRYFVAQVEEGHAVLQRARVLKAVETYQEPGKAPEVTTNPLQGKVVVIKSPLHGEPSFTDEQGRALAAKEWAGVCDDLIAGVPDADLSAMKIGQPVKAKPEALQRSFRLVSGGTGDMQVKLAEILRRGGRRLARLEFTVSVKSSGEKLGEGKGTYQMQGNAFIDLDRRHPYLLEGSGTMRLEVALPGSEGGAGPTLEGKATMRTEFEDG